MMCESFSYTHICKSCQQKFLQPSLYKRTLHNNIQLLSFYKYNEIKELLHTKHTDVGYHIYNILAKHSFAKFAEELHTKENYISIPIDDQVTSGYSHTAILNKHLNSYNIKPMFNKLRAKNSVSYSGKSKYFRENNPRDFELKNFQGDKIILVDDIVTTGLTMKQAIDLIGHNRVALALSLVDISQK
ncbi:phosphoribosyltransferase family protein [Sulfurimonas microaerophilic]|uniref:phosphoribosyltransferase family protein n=1 Tax=Sulfurimonas microaerophilic TaxID=3058392 RepID=UPI0027154D75|nr:phosphoribosyltransferase family protein [Sulfurimonas sp. hsl 1-7]